jgi:hypothetical protein
VLGAADADLPAAGGISPTDPAQAGDRGEHTADQPAAIGRSGHGARESIEPGGIHTTSFQHAEQHIHVTGCYSARQDAARSRFPEHPYILPKRTPHLIRFQRSSSDQCGVPMQLRQRD